MVIHKIQINAVQAYQKRVMPVDAKILCLKLQQEEPVIYYTTENPDVKTEKTFHVTVTGQELRENTTYIGTALFDEDTFVVHFSIGD